MFCHFALPRRIPDNKSLARQASRERLPVPAVISRGLARAIFLSFNCRAGTGILQGKATPDIAPCCSSATRLAERHILRRLDRRTFGRLFPRRKPRMGPTRLAPGGGAGYTRVPLPLEAASYSGRSSQAKNGQPSVSVGVLKSVLLLGFLRRAYKNKAFRIADSVGVRKPDNELLERVVNWTHHKAALSPAKNGSGYHHMVPNTEGHGRTVRLNTKRKQEHPF